MDVNYLRNGNHIVLECVSGSRAYGLDTETSDTDIKGVYILPKSEYYSLNYTAQINNPSNDIVFYELKRFLELLAVNNPNIIELLSTPESSIIYKHPILNQVQPEMFLSKLCKDTFGRFALSQIKKAKGLKKKIVNPVELERKTILSFCHINYAQGSIPLLKYLELEQIEQSRCGLVNIPNMKNIYGLYYSEELQYNGIMKSENSNDVNLSSIPKDEKQKAILYFNKDGYSVYCKEYKEYWDWVEHRNENRYQNTITNGENYDAKNMMHVFRLLDMAIEIGREGRVNVLRPNRKFLLSIKSGEFKYDELLRMANEKQIELEQAFLNSNLPETPNIANINLLAYQLRDEYYTSKFALD